MICIHTRGGLAASVSGCLIEISISFPNLVDAIGAGWHAIETQGNGPWYRIMGNYEGGRNAQVTPAAP